MKKKLEIKAIMSSSTIDEVYRYETYLYHFCFVKPWWKRYSKTIPIIGHMIKNENFHYEVGEIFITAMNCYTI